MPKTNRVIPGINSPRHDHHGTTRIPIAKKNLLADAKKLSEQANVMSDDMILRAAKIDGKKNIYFRANTASTLNSRLKNKNEVAENRNTIKKILNQVVEAFEEERDGKVSRKERTALNTIHALAAREQGDITAGDVREVLKVITKSADVAPNNQLRKIYQSPLRTNSGNLAIMLGRFKVIGDGEKNNLKKLLFPDSSRISLLSQDKILSQMMFLVKYKIDHPKAPLEKIVNQCEDKKSLEKFVDAWTSFRSKEEKNTDNPFKQSKQFGWTPMMDMLCKDLNELKIGSVTNAVAPDGTVSQKTPVASNPKLKSRSASKLNPELNSTPASTPKKVQTTVKKKNLLRDKPNVIYTAPKITVRKSVLSPLKISTAMTKIASQSISLSPGNIFIGNMPRTESNEIVSEIAMLEKTAIQAMVRADTARQRLVAIYQRREADKKLLNQHAISGNWRIHDLSMRPFGVVRDAISAASSAASPLPSGLNLGAVFESGVSVSSVPMPLAFSNSESSSLVESSELMNSPTKLNAAVDAQSSTANNS